MYEHPDLKHFFEEDFARTTPMFTHSNLNLKQGRLFFVRFFNFFYIRPDVKIFPFFTQFLCVDFAQVIVLCIRKPQRAPTWTSSAARFSSISLKTVARRSPTPTAATKMVALYRQVRASDRSKVPKLKPFWSSGFREAKGQNLTLPAKLQFTVMNTLLCIPYIFFVSTCVFLTTFISI